jgi:hypothetical protein
MSEPVTQGFREVAAGLARYPSHPALYRTVRT